MRLLNRSILTVLLSVLTATAFCHASALAGSSHRSGPVPGRFVVRLSTKANPLSVQSQADKYGQLVKATTAEWRQDIKGTDRINRTYVFATSDTTLTESDVIEMIGSENIELIEPDYYLELFDYPTDPLFPYQWDLNNTGQEYPGILRRGGDENDSLVMKQGVAGNDIDITGQYDSPPAETTKVVVGVIDTGVDMVHPELVGRIWHNPDEIPDNGIDDDHNGYIDDVTGYDLSGDSLDILNIVGDNNPTDQEGHGTHVAGIVASNADGQGIVGVAPFVEIMPVKTFPNATSTVGAAGIMYAVNAGARIINVSWGSNFQSFVLKEAIDFAQANGVFVAVSAGNSGTNERFYPAAFESSFTVGAGNSSGYMTEFSTYGAHLDLVAPGEDILSLRAAGTDLYAEAGEPNVHIYGPDSLYYIADGTSMAAPVVAGAAALIWSSRPYVTLSQLEDALRQGARDMVDPRDLGDTLIGPDTLSGWGYLDIGNAMALLQSSGISIVSPERDNRYTLPVEIKIASFGSYSGGFVLEYALGQGSETWLPLASGTSVPTDSIAATFDEAGVNEYIRLRLTDDSDNEFITGFYYVQSDRFEITSPSIGEEFHYSIAIYGSIFGPTYDSLSISYQNGGPEAHIVTITREVFDTLIYKWSISGLESGPYNLNFHAYFDGSVVDTSIAVTIQSSFTAGWPQPLGGRAALTPVTADLNHDGVTEVIVGTLNGLVVFHGDGSQVAGFPALPDEDMRCVPAVYDVDRDGEDEIICVSETGLHVFKYDGSYAAGFPHTCPTGLLAYGYPVPTVTKLGASADSAIVLVASDGQVYAYEFNGDSYFYSLEGFYGSLTDNVQSASYYSGNGVASSDMDGDGRIEVAAAFSGTASYSGLGVLDGRTGQPAFDMPVPQIEASPTLYGMVLADLDGDGQPEIIANGTDGSGASTIWVKTKGQTDVEGWPVQLPETEGWLSSYPMVADLDLDGVPEILVSYFGLEIGELYIFRADGTPYIDRPGRPYGEAFLGDGTFGVPIVADLVGDSLPEIVFRAGHIFPGTGPERVFILDNAAEAIPGWPIETPTSASAVFSTPFAPLVDDIDGDGLVELLLIGEGNDVFVWDFSASSNGGLNRGRLYYDNMNSSYYRPPSEPTTVGKAGGR